MFGLNPVSIAVAFSFWLAFSLQKAAWVAGNMGLNRPEVEVDPSY